MQEVLQKMLKDQLIQQCRYRNYNAGADGIVTEQMTSKQALQVSGITCIDIASLCSSVSVEAKLSFVERGRRWAHSPSPSKVPGISY